MTQKTISSKTFIFNIQKEIIEPCNKGHFIEAIIRAQVHIARIAKRLLIEKFTKRIRRIKLCGNIF